MTIKDMTDEQQTAIRRMRQREAFTAETTEGPDRNIIFVGDGEPPLSIHGAFKAELPDAETQRAGFYHEKAREIIAHFPSRYKRFKRKGDK